VVRFPAKRVSFLTSNNIQCSYEPVFLRFCDAYYNDTLHNELNCDTQHNELNCDTQHNELNCDTQHKHLVSSCLVALIIVVLSLKYPECRI
jgi:hypothetical protein